jgi:hypothetical protein
MLSANIAVARAYGDDAIFAIVASKGPLGGRTAGGGPEKLIYLLLSIKNQNKPLKIFVSY